MKPCKYRVVQLHVLPFVICNDFNQNSWSKLEVGQISCSGIFIALQCYGSLQWALNLVNMT